MPTNKTKIPVIAVFGSHKVHLDLAREIGRRIALEKCILLTGGEKGDGGATKGLAIAGAMQARYPIAGATEERDPAIGAWIGVAGGETKRGKPKNPFNDSFVLYPGVGDARNYIEASLCDVAIAIEPLDNWDGVRNDKDTGAGTLSEAMCCLFLRKPVVLVGSTWKTQFSVRNKTKRKELIHRAFLRVRDGVKSSARLEKILRQKKFESKLARKGLKYKYHVPQDDAAEIVKIAKGLAGKHGCNGAFPRLEKEYDAMAEAYRKWLERIRTALRVASKQAAK